MNTSVDEPSQPAFPGHLPYQNPGIGVPRGTPKADHQPPTNMQQQSLLNLHKQISNLAILKFLEFNEAIGIRATDPLNLNFWKQMIGEYFNNDIGIMKYSFKHGSEMKQFEINSLLLPRFFLTLMESGVCKLEISSHLIKSFVLASGCTYVESSRISIKHWYDDGSYVTIYGICKVMFNQQLKIDWLDFQTHHFMPGVEWPTIEQKLGSAHEGIDIKSHFKVFRSLSSSGFQESVMRFIQVGDVMGHLSNLMKYNGDNEGMSPLQALSSFVKTKSMDNDSPSPKGGGDINLNLDNSVLTQRRKYSLKSQKRASDDEDSDHKRMKE